MNKETEIQLDLLNTNIAIADINRIRFNNNLESLQDAIKKATEVLLDNHPINEQTRQNR